jgi:eukaryotic-like serine/threonine-protein kinase
MSEMPCLATCDCAGKVRSRDWLYLVRALVANAVGDMAGAQVAVRDFVSESRPASENQDLTVGNSGTLLGSTLLASAFQMTPANKQSGLFTLATDLRTRMWSQLESETCQRSKIEFLGIAHGWAGILYAELLWCEKAGAAVSSIVQARVEELASLGYPTQKGVRWKGSHDLQMMGGWCHGAAGYVHLWSLAGRVFRDVRYSDLALRTAEECWSHQGNNGTLCCGLAGQAYAMLDVYQLSGEAIWRQRAENLAASAAGFVGTRWCLPNSLYKGDLGIALLAADLSTPEMACMPLFGDEKWPAVTAMHESDAVHDESHASFG